MCGSQTLPILIAFVAITQLYGQRNGLTNVSSDLCLGYYGDDRVKEKQNNFLAITIEIIYESVRAKRLALSYSVVQCF